MGVVATIGAKCRRCYNCVRSCPAKAIRVQSGQAWVIEERCIGCGNCIRVCAQNAKQVQDDIPAVKELLAKETPVVAILAPSYPAAYAQANAEQVVAAVRALGFTHVMEVGFGAELVARRYAEILRKPVDHPLISTACPALVSYVEKYLPELIPCLVPVVSPMIALGRVVREHLHPGAAIVFIGPCTAKKAEIRDEAVSGVVDRVLTFAELQVMFADKGIKPERLVPTPADPPLPHYGALFPISGGLLQAAAIEADLMDDSVVVVEGHDRCIVALQELKEGSFEARFLDALLCEGCIAGPAFADDTALLARKQQVTAHVRSLQPQARGMKKTLRRLRDVNLDREFILQPLSLPMPTEIEIRDALARVDKTVAEDELNCGACGYPTCRDKAIAVCQGLAEPEMCLPYLIDQLQVNLEKLNRSKEEIEAARELASRAEQLASMGQLAADIAHEISNPLGQVIVFAQLLRDSMDEKDERREDLATITGEAMHCRSVMSALQGFARQRQPRWETVHISNVVEKAMTQLETDLAFSEIPVKVSMSDNLPPMTADADLLAQVIVNLVTNSVEAVDENGSVELSCRPAQDRRHLEIIVADNGPGVDPEILPQVFQPFVTTKSARGAGLGLALTHGIVHAHGGDINIESRAGAGTQVTVRLPLDVMPATTTEGVKVLVVDDDPDFLEQHRLRLAAVGFNVITADRSDEALEVSAREIPMPSCWT